MVAQGLSETDGYFLGTAKAGPRCRYPGFDGSAAHSVDVASVSGKREQPELRSVPTSVFGFPWVMTRSHSASKHSAIGSHLMWVVARGEVKKILICKTLSRVQSLSFCSLNSPNWDEAKTWARPPSLGIQSRDPALILRSALPQCVSPKLMGAKWSLSAGFGGLESEVLTPDMMTNLQRVLVSSFAWCHQLYHSVFCLSFVMGLPLGLASQGRRSASLHEQCPCCSVSQQGRLRWSPETEGGSLMLSL